MSRVSLCFAYGTRALGWAALAGLALASLIASLVAPPASAQSRGPSTPLVRFPFPQDDGTLTPYTFELGYPLVTLVYDTVMWRDSAGVPRPWLARSVRRSRDGRRLTIRLRKGIRWHDGAPLTAADVAFTFNFVAARRHPRFTPQLSDVRRVRAPGRLTVIIDLRRPSSGFADQPLADLPILPRHRWEGLPRGRRAPPGLPIGSGPYRLVQHHRERGYRFRANGSYFRGAPRVRTIRVPIIGDAEETIRALERRRVDMIPVSLPEEGAERLEGLAIRVVRGPSYLGTVLMLNLRHPPFDRPVVRQAMASAIDRGRTARAVGQAVPSDRGYLHPASPWSSGPISRPVDEGAAGRVLRGLAMPTLPVLAPNNDPVKLEAGRQVALALERAGARARLQPVPQPELARAVGQDDSPPTYQAAVWSAPPLASYDPDYLRRIFGSQPEESPLNYSGYRSAAFDRLAARVSAILGRRARQEAVAEELRLLDRDLPVVPLFFSDGAFAYRPAVYDGWVFVKGSGILDKRSFLRPERRSAPESGEPLEGSGAPESSSIGPLGLVALALLGAAVLLGAVGLMRRRA